MPTSTFAEVLQRTLAIFVKQPVALLACAFLCFALPALLGTLVYSALSLIVFTRNDNFFATMPSIQMAQLLVQGMLGAVSFLVGRGALTWIVLQSAAQPSQPVSLHLAFRAALRKWQPLLVSSLLYGALISIGVAGFAWLLREVRLDVSNFRGLRNDAHSVFNMMLVRSIGSLPPDPGAPFSDLYAAVRYTLSRQGGAAYTFVIAPTPLNGLPLTFVLSGVLSVLLLILVEALLCLRTAVIMCARDDDKNAAGWLRTTVALAARDMGRVLAWRWAVRLMLVALLAVFFVFPTALQQSVAVSLMIREVRAYWPVALNTALYSVAAALVGAIVLAFNTAFEAQMYLTLTNGEIGSR